MTETVLLEVISIVSFLFTILTPIMPYTSLSRFLYIFIWTVFSSAVFGIYYSKRKIYRILILLLIIPVLFFKSSQAIYFFLIIAAIMYFYLTRHLLKGDYRDYGYNFKKSIAFIAGLMFIFSLSESTGESYRYLLPFLIIYLLSSLILIRTLRHLDSNMDISVIQRLNRRYLIIIIITSFLVTIDKLRGVLFFIVGSIYKIIVNIVLTILYTILYYPLNLIFYYMQKLVYSLMLRQNTQEEQPMEIVGFDLSEFIGEEYAITESPIVDYALQVIFLILISYIIYRVIKKSGTRQEKDSEYIIEREFIRGLKNKTSTRKRFFKPRNLQEQIRYYYRKYLVRLKSNEIIIEDSNTTLEINEMAQQIYNKQLVDEIRDIYIENRYGNKKSTKNDVKKIEELYKQIKSQD